MLTDGTLLKHNPLVIILSASLYTEVFKQYMFS